MSRLKLFLVTFFALFFMTAPSAFAADATPAQTNSWQYQGAMLAISTLSLIAATAIPIVALWFRKKYKLETSAIMDEQIQKFIERGIGYAEEQAAKAVNGSDIGKAPSGNAKLDVAADFVLGAIKAAKLPEKSAEIIKNRIEAHLGMTGTGATANVGGTTSGSVGG